MAAVGVAVGLEVPRHPGHRRLGRAVDLVARAATQLSTEPGLADLHDRERCGRHRPGALLVLVMSAVSVARELDLSGAGAAVLQERVLDLARLFAVVLQRVVEVEEVRRVNLDAVLLADVEAERGVLGAGEVGAAVRVAPIAARLLP